MQVFTPSAHPADRENNTVLILRDAQAFEEKTEGGLYKPQQSVEMANQGTVRAVSTNSSYQPEDRVVFVKYSGAEIELNSVTYTLLKEKEIQGTVTEVGSSTKSNAENAADLQAALAKFEEQASAQKNS